MNAAGHQGLNHCSSPQWGQPEGNSRWRKTGTSFRSLQRIRKEWFYCTQTPAPSGPKKKTKLVTLRFLSLWLAITLWCLTTFPFFFFIKNSYVSRPLLTSLEQFHRAMCLPSRPLFGGLQTEYNLQLRLWGFFFLQSYIFGDWWRNPEQISLILNSMKDWRWGTFLCPSASSESPDEYGGGYWIS